jgi:hypothetical protein
MRTGAKVVAALRSPCAPVTRRVKPARYAINCRNRAFSSALQQRSGANLKRPIFAKYYIPPPSNHPPEQPCESIWTTEDGSKRLLEEIANLNPTPELERELFWVAHHEPDLPAVEALLVYLIVQRQLQPTAVHYEAAVVANCDPMHGSAEYAQTLAENARASGLQAASLLDTALLQVLAVHPNQVMREALLKQVRQQWVEVPETARFWNVASLLREGQTEIAQLELKTLQAQNVEVPDWVWLLLAHEHCSRHDFEALICLLHDFHDQRVRLPRQTASHILTEAANYGHKPTVHWIWMRHVQPGFVRPDKACCDTVAQLAAKEKDFTLERRALALKAQIAVQGHPLQNEPTDQPPAFEGEQVDEAASSWLKDAPLPEEGFFDPWEALAKRPEPRYLEPRWLQKRERHQRYLRWVFGKLRKSERDDEYSGSIIDRVNTTHQRSAGFTERAPLSRTKQYDGDFPRGEFGHLLSESESPGTLTPEEVAEVLGPTKTKKMWVRKLK